MEFLPVEEDCREPYAAYAAAVEAGDAARAIDMRVEVLRRHPFVRQAAETTSTHAVHSFSSRGFSLNIVAFVKWLRKPEGRVFRDRAGGMSDDGLYTISALMRVRDEADGCIVVVSSCSLFLRVRCFFVLLLMQLLCVCGAYTLCQ
jgi:hypothetical protein